MIGFWYLRVFRLLRERAGFSNQSMVLFIFLRLFLFGKWLLIYVLWIKSCWKQNSRFCSLQCLGWPCLSDGRSYFSHGQPVDHFSLLSFCRFFRHSGSVDLLLDGGRIFSRLTMASEKKPHGKDLFQGFTKFRFLFLVLCFLCWFYDDFIL